MRSGRARASASPGGWCCAFICAAKHVERHAAHRVDRRLDLGRRAAALETVTRLAVEAIEIGARERHVRGDAKRWRRRRSPLGRAIASGAAAEACLGQRDAEARQPAGAGNRRDRGVLRGRGPRARRLLRDARAENTTRPSRPTPTARRTAVRIWPPSRKMLASLVPRDVRQSNDAWPQARNVSTVAIRSNDRATPALARKPLASHVLTRMA